MGLGLGWLDAAIPKNNRTGIAQATPVPRDVNKFAAGCRGSIERDHHPATCGFDGSRSDLYRLLQSRFDRGEAVELASRQQIVNLRADDARTGDLQAGVLGGLDRRDTDLTARDDEVRAFDLEHQGHGDLLRRDVLFAVLLLQPGANDDRQLAVIDSELDRILVREDERRRIARRWNLLLDSLRGLERTAEQFLER